MAGEGGTCPECGVFFRKKINVQKYCGPRCAAEVQKRQMKEYFRTPGGKAYRERNLNKRNYRSMLKNTLDRATSFRDMVKEKLQIAEEKVGILELLMENYEKTGEVAPIPQVTWTKDVIPSNARSNHYHLTARKRPSRRLV